MEKYENRPTSDEQDIIVEEEVAATNYTSNINTVTINIEGFKNIAAWFPIADIKAICEYGEITLGESGLFPIADDNYLPVDQDFQFQFNADLPEEIDKLVSSPVKCQHQFTETLFIKPTEKFLDERMNSYKKHPSIIVTVSIDPGLADNLTVMNMTVESIFNIPSLMRKEMIYRVGWTLPRSENCFSGPFILTNPLYTSEQVTDSYKCWPDMQRIGDDANTTKYRTSGRDQPIVCKFEKNIQKFFDEDSPKLQFNMLRRNYLTPNGLTELSTYFKIYKNLVIEILMTKEKGTKNASAKSFSGSGKINSQATRSTISKEDELVKVKDGKVPFLHCMAIADVSRLLCPGATRVRIAVPLRTFVFEEAHEAGLSDSMFFPKPKVLVETPSGIKKSKADKDKSSAKSGKSSKKSKESKKQKKADKTMKNNLKKDLPPAPVQLPEIEPSVQVFSDSGKPCFIVIDIEISQSIIPKHVIEDISEGYWQLLQKGPERPVKIVMSSCISHSYYKEVLSEIIQDINQKYLRFLEENPTFRGIPKNPYIYFEVISRKTWERYTTEGLGYKPLPVSKPGQYSYQLSCFRFDTRGPYGGLRRFFIGDFSNYKDIKSIGLPEQPPQINVLNKYGTYTIGTGQLNIRLNVLHQSQAFLPEFYEGIKKETFIYDKLNASGLIRSVNQVLLAFNKARKNLAEVKKNL